MTGKVGSGGVRADITNELTLPPRGGRTPTHRQSHLEYLSSSFPAARVVYKGARAIGSPPIDQPPTETQHFGVSRTNSVHQCKNKV